MVLLPISVQVIYDAAHAFGCRASPDKARVGNFGDAECFSFHATKFFNSGEGGAIATNSERTAARCRYFRNFAFAGYDLVVGLGTNAKMSEVHAAIVNCGGLCPGINDVVRSIVTTLEVGYGVTKISGVRYGFGGFWRDGVETMRLTRKNTSG